MGATRYDLHSHSTASDGTFSPSELVRHAKSCDVDVLALTDHDTTAGLSEAQKAAQACGMQLVSGVEVSVTWARQTVHIVGLNIDPECRALRAGLARHMSFRDWRAGEIGRRLEKVGIQGALQGAHALTKGRIVTRTHFARFLLSQGSGRSVQDVFRRYLVRNKPGYVAGQWAGLEEAVGWIRNAGGQSVIAHPARYRMTATKLRALVGEFTECGGAAIEVVSGSHARDDCAAMARLACRFGLMASSGSDYHGPENPWVEMGGVTQLPESVQPIWAAW